MSKQGKILSTDKEIEAIKTFMKEHEKDKPEYDDQPVRKYISLITVFHERFHAEFKAGLETDVWREN